ncbi:hypothetical protein L486_08478 [Kwoniella mangroviensis CBS 10435]|uniref:Uncharacterized protein n=1 Tax=Kwoniella mangroviensis CBS 10435 TaxID=1331196 RepID=A0A1B9IEC0_9TREE|nr:hypothetical protein L486_08478 [Kwoniella mangroviensis CBS 10435]OCF71069.1 hypothetical protein I204_08305 [Kwoniella mangroviensis CBS 8886]
MPVPMPMFQDGNDDTTGFYAEPQDVYSNRSLSDQGLDMTTTGIDQLSLTGIIHKQDHNNYDFLFSDLANQSGCNPVEIAYENNVSGYLPSFSSAAGLYTALPEGYHNDTTTRNQFQAYSQGLPTDKYHPQAIRYHPPGQFDKRSMMCEITRPFRSTVKVVTTLPTPLSSISLVIEDGIWKVRSTVGLIMRLLNDNNNTEDSLEIVWSICVQYSFLGPSTVLRNIVLMWV